MDERNRGLRGRRVDRLGEREREDEREKERYEEEERKQRDRQD